MKISCLSDDAQILMRCPLQSKLLATIEQGRNHVFKVGGPIPRSGILLAFYRKKLDRSAQFGAVSYIITLYSPKTYVKSWRSVKFWGSVPPNPPVVAPMQLSPLFTHNATNICQSICPSVSGNYRLRDENGIDNTMGCWSRMVSLWGLVGGVWGEEERH